MSRVLIFNFFGGVVDRGIPLYAENVAEGMRRAGLKPIVLRCPRVFGRAPRSLRNALFVFFEQLIAPLARVLCRCSLTVYPYNSAGLVDALLGRAVVVVHDLLSNDRANQSLSARYVRATQAVHRALKRPVCAASAVTFGRLRRLRAFGGCSLQLWPNGFYSFEAALKRRGSVPRREPSAPLRVLLCSGTGANKDYGGALKLFAHSRVLRKAELRVVGFGNDAGLARRRVALLPDRVRARIEILPRLALVDVVEEYLAADIVWVHSRDEGFGRSVAEGRLAGRAIVATDTRAFRAFAGAGVYLYDDDHFDAAIARSLEDGPVWPFSVRSYHADIEAAVVEGVRVFTELAKLAHAERAESRASRLRVE